MGKFFDVLDSWLHIDSDPLRKFEFDPNNESHAKLLEDYRKRLVLEADTCFYRCVDMNTAGFSSSEDKCVRKCIQDSIKFSKLVVDAASKAV
jgi:Tim10/DDP family zinc finger